MSPGFVLAAVFDLAETLGMPAWESIFELVANKLPKTPSRKALPALAARIVTGGLCGAAFGVIGQSLWIGLCTGVIGSIVGTLGGYEFRVRLVKAIGGKDFPVALLEDLIAVGGSLFIVTR